jgi:hypothetical protein
MTFPDGSRLNVYKSLQYNDFNRALGADFQRFGHSIQKLGRKKTGQKKADPRWWTRLSRRH